MKRLLLVVGLAVLAVACQKQHPVKLVIDEGLQKTAEDGTPLIEKIAVFHFASALNDADDPDGLAPETMEAIFAPALDDRSDYKFIAPGTIDFAIDREGWGDLYREFMEDYPSTKEPDMDFLSRLAEALRCDAFLIPVVDTWYKDEVDFRESASATTTVGATIKIIDAKVEPGKILFEASDEDYLESARSEVEDRTVVRSASGTVRSDQGAKLYRAPPFSDVAVKVCEALVSSLPAR